MQTLTPFIIRALSLSTVSLLIVLSFYCAKKIHLLKKIMPQSAYLKQNPNHLALLLEAVEKNDIVRLRWLIEQGIEVNLHTGDELVPGITPLMKAAEKGSLEMIQLLIDIGADVNAIAWRDQPHAGKPVLYFAIESGSLAAITMLIKVGADVNEFVECPLIYHPERPSANERNLTLLSCVINTNAPLPIIKILIDNGANVNKKSMIGFWTPLMVAAYKGNEDAIAALLTAGADKTTKNKTDGDRTALDYAKEQNHTKIIHLLQSDVCGL